MRNWMVPVLVSGLFACSAAEEGANASAEAKDTAAATQHETSAAASTEGFPITLNDESEGEMGEAFLAAFNKATVDSEDGSIPAEVDGLTYDFVPLAMHKMSDDVWVLFSGGSRADAGHSDGGVNAVHYLRDQEGGWQLIGGTQNIGSTGTVGNPATAWAFTEKLGKNPYLITSGGGVWQGCMVESTTVTELTPTGAVDRGTFTNAMSSGAGIGQTEQQYDGVITAAVPDKSFTVRYTGSETFDQTFERKGDRYQIVGKDRVPGC